MSHDMAKGVPPCHYNLLHKHYNIIAYPVATSNSPALRRQKSSAGPDYGKMDGKPHTDVAIAEFYLGISNRNYYIYDIEKGNKYLPLYSNSNT